MKTKVKKTNCIIMFSILILMSNFAHSGAPEGTWESIPHEVQEEVVNVLMQQGLCRDRDCDRLAGWSIGAIDRLFIENGITTYLLDNRNLLTMEPIPKHRQVDVLVCLMMRQGKSRVEFRSPPPEFCSIHIRGEFQDANSPNP